MPYLIPTLSWLMTLWISRVFLFSLTYKFTGAPETEFIFGTIGAWMTTTISPALGQAFTNYGAIVTGIAELIVSLVLLAPALFWILHKAGLMEKPNRAKYHRIGGFLAALIMLGAVSFHLLTPLGIEVLHEGQSDGGSLFYTGVIILVLGVIMGLINRSKK